MNRPRLQGCAGYVLLVVVLLASRVAALHDTGCVPTQADPSTYYEFTLQDGRHFYIQEQDEQLPGPLVPGSGFVTGDGTFIYEETNGLTGLQKGDGNELIFCLITQPTCIFPQWDPWGDYNCGHGPDEGWLFLWWL